MDIEKIKNFYAVRAEYFKKKAEIANAMLELDMLLHEANFKLKETVDNDFTDEYLVKVEKAYSSHKFNSAMVGAFIKKIDSMFFKDLDAKLKDRLEVTSISIRASSEYFESKKSIDGPVAIDFHDIESTRAFRLVVPVKSAVCTDMVHWTDNGDGMYIVRADAPSADISKEICRVFDKSKVAVAVEKYLKGEFDEDIVAETFNLYGKRYKIYPKQRMSIDMADMYENDAKYIEVHDLFGYNVQIDPPDDVVANCICDIKDYASEKQNV